VVAVPMAQNKTVELARIEVQQFKVADQNLGRIAKVQQILEFSTGLDGFAQEIVLHIN
jgi:uncharacterized protein YkvS